MIAFRRGERSVFLYGFAKSERANIDDDELEALRDLARAYLELDVKKIEAAIAAGELLEVNYGEKEERESRTARQSPAAVRDCRGHARAA